MQALVSLIIEFYDRLVIFDVTYDIDPLVKLAKEVWKKLDLHGGLYRLVPIFAYYWVCMPYTEDNNHVQMGGSIAFENTIGHTAENIFVFANNNIWRS